jgi:hypothetical protein
MAHYLLSVYPPADFAETLDEPTIERLNETVDEYNDRLKAAGAWVFAGGLHPASSATTVREQGGRILTTDGPFLEVKEHVGGFYVIDVPDLDAALRWAADATVACMAAIEVRPFDGVVD